ncbi:MAG: ATP-grasp domain-containing protein [Calditrichia bacterium]
MLKPLFLSASRGVIRANNRDEFVAAFERISNLIADPAVAAKAYDDEASHILVESYIPGVEIALEGILINGEFKTLAIFDKPDPLEGLILWKPSTRRHRCCRHMCSGK